MIPPNLLLDAYSKGAFPMAMDNGEIGWFSPHPRGVIPLDGFLVPHGLARTLRKELFEVRINTAFERVMRECAAREETWINGVILDSYCELHRLGLAHSVETWRDGELAGGLYGVSLGGVFCGESMFHHVTDASKVALHALVARLRARDFRLLDVQWLTPHLSQFGAVEIPRAKYMRQLAACVGLERRFV